MFVLAFSTLVSFRKRKNYIIQKQISSFGPLIKQLRIFIRYQTLHGVVIYDLLLIQNRKRINYISELDIRIDLYFILQDYSFSGKVHCKNRSNYNLHQNVYMSIY